MEAEDKYIGKQIGNYRIEKALNSGAFGKVYQGVHIYLSNREVAIKLMHHNHLGSDEERESFLQEASYLELLKHKHILPIYDVGVDEEGFPYLIAELAEKGSLRDRLDDSPEQLLSIDEILDISTQIGQALQFVHEQNIVHRDLKPENILFNSKGQALLADFGIAVFLETTKTKYANVIGSPLYMAPEQFEGLASRRSDQYALACILYELVTGHPPFVANHALAIGMKHQKEQPLPPSLFNPDLPAHMEQAILRGLAKRREDRYPDVNAFITALLTTTTGTLQKTREQWLDEGYSHFNTRRFKDAISSFEEAMRQDPAYADPYEGLGSVLFQLGRFAEALKCYDRAIQLEPRYAAAYCGKGNILAEQKHYDEALRYYERAVQLDPQLAEAYVGMGSALYYQGMYPEANLAYEKAIACDSTNVPAHEGQGWALQHMRQYEASIRSFAEAIDLDPTNLPAHTGQGRSYYRLGRYKEAMNCYDRAIKIDPNYVQAHDFRSDVFFYTHRYEEALASYDQVIKLNPTMATGHDGRGWSLVRLGRFEEAVAPFESAIEIDPDDASAWNGKGRALYELKQYKEALACYDQAIQINPHLANAYNDKGNLLYDFRRYEDALHA
ncbi:MAG TPA: tetratricopeptide repeat protein, partial [Ktedonobacteraceae bacterium]